jgi:secondary thiamine-phosphate synthase enzyme
MVHVKQLSIRSRERTQFIKLDAEVENVIAESGVVDGICHVFVLHTTAGVMINEGADPSVVHDIGAKLTELVPREGRYAHADAERNADSHIKATLVGSSVTVLVKGGAPLLGTWQSIFLCEFDGPRQRQVVVRVSDG